MSAPTLTTMLKDLTTWYPAMLETTRKTIPAITPPPLPDTPPY